MLRLVNHYEEVAHDAIKIVAHRWGLSVYPKVRVADVIELDRLGVVGDLKRFGLQSHFDFLVCRDQWEPVYAVEFDGRYHSTPKQVERDRKKDDLCRRACFPILRINSNYLSSNFGSISLLAWLMDVHELQQAFEAVQEAGSVPWDEPFDPFLILGDASKKERFPYWLSAKPRVLLRRLYEAGVVPDPLSSGLIGYDEEGVLRGADYIRVSQSAGLFVRTAMRPQIFPVRMSELLHEILAVQLSTKVEAWRCGEIKPSPLSEVREITDSMRTQLRLAMSWANGAQSTSPGQPDHSGS